MLPMVSMVDDGIDHDFICVTYRLSSDASKEADDESIDRLLKDEVVDRRPCDGVLS